MTYVAGAGRGRWPRVDPAIIGLIACYAVAVVALQASGRLDVGDAGILLTAPLLGLVALFYPALLVLLYVAIPPGLLSSTPKTSVGPMTFLFGAALAAFVIVRGGFTRGFVPSVAPIALLAVGAFTTIRAIDPSAHSAAAEFRRGLVFYAVLLGIAYLLARYGDLDLASLGTALLLAAGISGLVFLNQLNFQPWEYSVSQTGLEPGGLFFRTHFGYMMALGFSVALARMTSYQRQDSRVRDAVVLGFFSLMVMFSFTRGAWLVAVLLLTLVPLRTGRRGYWLLLPTIAVVVLSVPLIQDRLVADIEGGLQQSLASGQIGTGRWGLWRDMMDRAGDGMPWGHGFGYVWDLSPSAIFGAETFTTEANPFVYVHNDFLYWTLEWGVIGLTTMILFWGRIVSALRRIKRSVGRYWTESSYVGGVILTMFVASMVDNGLFIRPLAERFFIVIGVVFALEVRVKETSRVARATR